MPNKCDTKAVWTGVIFSVAPFTSSDSQLTLATTSEAWSGLWFYGSVAFLSDLIMFVTFTAISSMAHLNDCALASLMQGVTWLIGGVILMSNFIMRDREPIAPPFYITMHIHAMAIPGMLIVGGVS
jgi:hypothetical protein